MKTQTLVVDLHIERIAKAYRTFAPADSLIYQLEVFERTLQANRLKKGGQIDFIHGSGTGVLRSELIKILNQKFPEFSYEDAPFTTYGYQGAIRVTVR
ncbi:MAG: Smr/MutS family protein [Bacteroidales bacterium]|nr:Smr/MutS family protein [Bacteroidales bacterium]